MAPFSLTRPLESRGRYSGMLYLGRTAATASGVESNVIVPAVSLLLCPPAAAPGSSKSAGMNSGELTV